MMYGTSAHRAFSICQAQGRLALAACAATGDRERNPHTPVAAINVVAASLLAFLVMVPGCGAFDPLAYSVDIAISFVVIQAAPVYGCCAMYPP